MSRGGIDVLKLVSYEDVFYNDMLELSVFDDQVSFIEDMKSTIEDYHAKAFDVDWVIKMIYDDSLLIGYVMYGLNSKHQLWIDRFLIDKSYQHQGLGKKAFKAILRYISLTYKDVTEICLSVNLKNIVATLFYQSFGFTQTGTYDGLEPIYKKELALK